jgi:hypothetical protein
VPEDEMLRLTLRLPESELKQLIAYMLWKKHKNSDESLRELIRLAFTTMVTNGVEIDSDGVVSVMQRRRPEPPTSTQVEADIKY